MGTMALSSFISVPCVEETILPSSVTQDVLVSLNLESRPQAAQLPTPFNFHTPLVHTNFSNDIHYRPCPPGASPIDVEIFEQVIHPYNISAFESSLHQLHLTDAHPLLIHNLTYGFPLGALPELEHSIIIPNHPFVAKNPEVVAAYIDAEMKAGRMSGPFSQVDVEHILCGPIYVSPLIVAEQTEGPGLPPKFCVCCHLSKDDPISGSSSVNSFIDKGDFPTH
jgi:hypothetical protein